MLKGVEDGFGSEHGITLGEPRWARRAPEQLTSDRPENISQDANVSERDPRAGEGLDLAWEWQRRLLGGIILEQRAWGKKTGIGRGVGFESGDVHRERDTQGLGLKESGLICR